MLLVVWIAVVVVALAVLGVLGYGVRGAAGRLDRELRGLQADVEPARADVEEALRRAAAQRQERPAATD
ncbi:hypothetical protein [Modestobacter sp. I12A-02662]|uniref:hypothetical protein n=1 Tax=Modestobacter sp. I12A-02662 TaxID=1730496 RepID=UPI0034E02042